ncbi:glycosyltransferase [Opitutales bacterium]|nr:glycosyltransferase [Opitutales bacterium]
MWGCDAIVDCKDWDASQVHTLKYRIPKVLEKLFNHHFFRNSPGIQVEFAAWKLSGTLDVIYSVCGPLTLSRFYKKTQLVSWVFQLPHDATTSILSSYQVKNLKKHKGFCCLTPKAEKDFSKYSVSQFIPWCIDLELFDGKPAIEKPKEPFFLATGKTGRDYNTLIKAAENVDAEIRIIAPAEQKSRNLPKNIKWFDTSIDPPDKRIDYPTLRQWYAQCIAVCIPLTGNTDDTCGYTNMLEAMAMAKPILMTKSGSLHINPEQRGFGLLVNPKDPVDWASSMSKLLKDYNNYKRIGMVGREIAESEFSLETFNNTIINFLKNCLKK